jgi:hypothetical protein
MELLPRTRVELRVRVQWGGRVEELMAEAEKEQIPSPLLLAFAPLHRVAMGSAVGVVLGGIVFLITAALLVKGGYPIGPRLALLAHYFVGYSVTWSGALIGLCWGFGIGFMLGWGFALLRNFVVWSWLSLIRSRAEMEQYGDFLDHL